MSRHILFAIDSLDSGGAERSTLEIGRRFARFRPLVFSLEPGGALANDFRLAKIEVFVPERPGRRHILSQTSSVIDVVRSRGVELVHSSLFWSELVTRMGSKR